MRYDNERDAASYLGNSIILYDGKPVIVGEVQRVPIQRSFVIQLMPLPKGSPFSTTLDDPKLNMLNIRLGNVTWGDNVYYLERIPIRAYKQGITSNNVNIVGPTGNLRSRDILGELRTTPGFVDMMMGVYPTAAEVKKKLVAAGVRKAIAVSRQFALSYNPDLEEFSLVYKGETVARSSDTRFKLPSRYQHLREFLMESGIETRAA